MQNAIANMLRPGTNFASITYTTQVQTAAAHKARNVQKTVVANVQLFSTKDAFTQVYANAVKRSAAQHDSNDANAVENFVAQSNYFEHTNCFSIVQHKQNAKQYLYAIFNNVSSVVYTIDGVVANKQQVSELLTASAKAKLLQEDNTVVNKTHNIVHNVQVRTIALDNVKSITCNKQTLAF